MINWKKIIIGLIVTATLFYGLQRIYDQVKRQDDVPMKSLPSVRPQTLPETQDALQAVKIISGNVIELDNGQQVRLIGVDSGKDVERNTQAAGLIQTLAGKGKLRLEFDVKRRDKYKRLLAYVFIDTDLPYGSPLTENPGYYEMVDHNGVYSHFVNAELVKAGYARAVPDPPNGKYDELFLKLPTDTVPGGDDNRGL